MTSSGGNWKDLLKAAEHGDVGLTRYHLRQGVDPNYQHPEYFTCPIFEAARNGHLEIVKILIEEGNANPNIVEDSSDSRPIEAALETGQHDIVDYLRTKLPKGETQWKPRQVLVTGGNRGIGKAICQLLLTQGHRVVFTCRSQTAGETTVQELKEATNNSKIGYIVGDLSSIRSSLALAETIKSQFPSINVLIHNAGIWPTKLELNEDGLEMSFAVNYIAPYILTRELGSLLEANAPSRIVFVSAGLYALGNADLHKTPFGKDFGMFATYKNTKQCAAILFQNTIRQYNDKQSNKVQVNAVHPGVIRTGLGESTNTWSLMDPMLRCFKRFWKTPLQGAAGPVWLAVSPEAEGVHGAYYDELKLSQMTGKVMDSAVQSDWAEWTKDFLARTSGASSD